MKKILLTMFVFLCLLNVSCSTAHYPPIESEVPLIISVNIKDNTISFVDADKKERIANWEMKKAYSGGLLFPDGDTLLLFGKHQEKADLYSLSTGKKIDEWKVGSGIANGIFIKNNEEIAFSDHEENAVRFFTLDGKEIGTAKTNYAPITLLEDEQTHDLYVVSHQSDKLIVLNHDGEKATHYTIHDVATGGLIVEEKNELWIGGHGIGVELEENIHVYDQRSGDLIKTIHAPTMPVNFATDDQFIYAISHGSNTLYKFTLDGEFLQSLKVGANPFSLKIFENYLFIAGYDSNDIQVVDCDQLEIIETIEVGKGPFQLILRERRE